MQAKRSNRLMGPALSEPHALHARICLKERIDCSKTLQLLPYLLYAPDRGSRHCAAAAERQDVLPFASRRRACFGSLL